MNKNKIIGIVMLVICTVIWGAAFSFQSMAAEHLGPFTVISTRFLLAAVVLSPVLIIYIKIKKISINWKIAIIGGIVTGAFLAFASIVQQFGIPKTSTGKAGFLTAMYIIFVPLLSIFLFKKKLKLLQIIGIVLTVIGIGLLSLQLDFSINLGDILCLTSGLLFAFQIIAVDHYSKKEDSMVLAVISFFSCGLIALPFSFIFETTSLDDLRLSIVPLLFLGIGSSAIAYTLQFLGQKKISGVPASIIMSLEAVFSAVFAWILLSEALSPKEIIGAVTMLVGVIVVQIFD